MKGSIICWVFIVWKNEDERDKTISSFRQVVVNSEKGRIMSDDIWHNSIDITKPYYDSLKHGSTCTKFK